MWLVVVRDLLWRKGRFLIAVVSASLVFSLTLVLDGLTHHIGNEVARAVDRYGADTWVVAPGESGPRAPCCRPRSPPTSPRCPA